MNSEEEGEIKSESSSHSKSSSNSDEGKSYVIPEDDDASTVGILDEEQPQKE